MRPDAHRGDAHVGGLAADRLSNDSRLPERIGYGGLEELVSLGALALSETRKVMPS